MKTIILVCCHKKSKCFENNTIKMIQLGAKLNPSCDFAKYRDDIGDNISAKNPQYCELSALYWAWRNLPEDFSYVGFFHYRRYLSFSKSNFVKKFLSGTPKINERLFSWDDEKIRKIIEQYDIILPRKTNLPFLSKGKDNKDNMYKHFCRNIGEKAVKLSCDIVNDEYPSYKKALQKSLLMQDVYFKNIFIMKREYFNEYMEFLFNILFKMEDKLAEEENRDIKSGRIYGFVAERLMNVFIENKRIEGDFLKILELDVIKKQEFSFSKRYFLNQYNKLQRRLNIKYIKSVVKYFKEKK